MKPTAAVASFLLLLLIAFTAFWKTHPGYSPDQEAAADTFSTDRALEHVRRISQKPHAVGFPAHREVRDYIVNTLEGMGLETQLQSGYTAGDWGNLSKAVNILARIRGKGEGKALLLMSHYDSSPHSSFGASDAGSGVATILEGVRAFLESGATPENDIILLLSDAEELGLNGADLFVNRHPWIRDIGLVLNFEARGSGGASFMLIETNRGNARLIDAFTRANPEYPVANSLAYSIYKMLPNDTDLTVFREDADIEGFNFAFIDDHFDYHTALDRADRLDRSTLAHQGSYLMPLLAHFSQSDLGGLKSLNDKVYFNLPFFKLISYPFDWIWPMWVMGSLFLLLLIVIGLRKGRLSLQGMALGFIPMILCLVIGGVTGYVAWPFLKTLYPEYADMLHGFTYNGHLYIAAWAALALGSCFLIYSFFRRVATADILVAPSLFWLVLCWFLNDLLPGAAFFLIPGLALLMSLLIAIYQEHPNPYILCLLGLPILWIFAPFVKMLPVGLGLKMMVAASLVSVLIFLLLLGLLHRFPKKRQFGWLGILAFLALMAGAHLQSGFDATNPKPTSLLYVLDTDQGQAQWATYENEPSEWTRAYLGSTLQAPGALNAETISSKYGTGFTYVSEAPQKAVPAPEVRILQDSIVDGQREIELHIVPQRPVNRLEVFTGPTPLSSASVNDIELSEYYLANRRGGKLVTHYISDNDPTRLRVSFPAGESLELTLYEASNDLLENPLFSVPERPAETLPMPFVLNDAVLLIKKLRFD